LILAQTEKGVLAEILKVCFWLTVAGHEGQKSAIFEKIRM
jgi:hypothetical protein